VHGTPGARSAFDNGGLPARFAVENIGIPAEIFRVEAIAYVPGAVYFSLFVKSGVEAKPETQKLGEVGLKAVLKRICVKFMFGKGHLQIEAAGIAHHFGVAVLFVGEVNEDKHSQQLELVIWFSRKDVLFERGQREEITYLCSELWKRLLRFDTDLKRHTELLQGETQAFYENYLTPL
jgi:hypothetical protein